MKMIRKQLYITDQQQRKLRRLAGRRGCTEAEVVRAALDALPDAEGLIDDRLRAAGALADPPDDRDLPSGPAAEGEAEALEAELDAWLATLDGPLGLSAAVIADRR
jgi:hypothetical protein